MYYERGYSTEQSVHLAKRIIKKLGLNYLPIKVSCDSNGFLVIAVVDENGNIVSAGKGIGIQSIASGLFESIEHYYYNNYSFPLCDIKDMSVKEIITQHPSLSEVVVLKMLSDYKDTLQCVRGFGITSYDAIWYPVFLLINPENITTNSPSWLLKYSSNNGLAVGVDRFECLIHAINEVMERESVSCHLQSVFIDRSIKSVRVLNQESLPSDILEFIVELEKNMQTHIQILDITSYQGFYTYFVYAITDKSPLPLKASGTSQIPRIALIRTLSELWQIYSLSDDNSYEQDMFIHNEFQDINEFYDIIMCRYSKLEIIDWNNCDENVITNYQDQFKKIIDFLSAHRLNAYEFPMQLDKRIYCSRIVILEADNFQLVNSGMKVVPRNRLRSV